MVYQPGSQAPMGSRGQGPMRSGHSMVIRSRKAIGGTIPRDQHIKIPSVTGNSSNIVRELLRGKETAV